MAQDSKHFACKDVGYECSWTLDGENEDEMLPIIEQHAAETHNLTHFKSEAEENVRKAIRSHENSAV